MNGWKESIKQDQYQPEESTKQNAVMFHMQIIKNNKNFNFSEENTKKLSVRQQEDPNTHTDVRSEHTTILNN